MRTLLNKNLESIFQVQLWTHLGASYCFQCLPNNEPLKIFHHIKNSYLETQQTKWLCHNNSFLLSFSGGCPKRVGFWDIYWDPETWKHMGKTIDIGKWGAIPISPTKHPDGCTSDHLISLCTCANDDRSKVGQWLYL